MDNYRIANKSELDAFISSNRNDGVTAIKGPPPPDAVYMDGDACTQPVNVAWMNASNGERCEIIYEHVNGSDAMGSTGDGWAV